MSYEHTPRSFGKLLKARRDERGFTLQEVAADLGISSQFLWRVEQGLTPFPSPHLIPLAKKMNIDPDVLVVEYMTPLMERIYSSAGLPKPKWRIVPSTMKVSTV